MPLWLQRQNGRRGAPKALGSKIAVSLIKLYWRGTVWCRSGSKYKMAAGVMRICLATASGTARSGWKKNRGGIRNQSGCIPILCITIVVVIVTIFFRFATPADAARHRWSYVYVFGHCQCYCALGLKKKKTGLYTKTELLKVSKKPGLYAKSE